MRLIFWAALIGLISHLHRKRMQQLAEAKQQTAKTPPPVSPRPKAVASKPVKPAPAAKPAAPASFASEYASLPEVVAARQTPEHRQEQPAAETDEQRADLPAFDLRTAILFSEILKPKFNEDEH